MILEPNRYQGKDGTEHIGFNAKLMYDRLDIVNAGHEPSVSYDMRQLIRALVSNCSVPIVTLRKEYPADASMGAYYDAEQQKIFAKGGMRPEEIFSSVAVAIAHSEMDRAIRKAAERNHTQPVPYRSGDHEFQARCASYVLCLKYHVPADCVSINSIPPKYAGMETEEIRKDLFAIHESVKEISGRMERILHPPEKKQDREER